MTSELPGLPQPASLEQQVALEEAANLSRRDVFLLEMYKQCSGHLNRHVTAMWQCFAVLVAFGATLRVDADGAPFDYAVTLALLLCTWLIASNLDASAWFNRNITIIANIERQFLQRADEKLIHPLFTKPHEADHIIMHFRIQIYFAITVSIILLLIHLHHRVIEVIAEPSQTFAHSTLVPYAVSVVSIVVLLAMRHHQQSQQKDINQRCPGRLYE